MSHLHCGLADKSISQFYIGLAVSLITALRMTQFHLEGKCLFYTVQPPTLMEFPTVLNHHLSGNLSLISDKPSTKQFLENMVLISSLLHEAIQRTVLCRYNSELFKFTGDLRYFFVTRVDI